MPIVLVPLGGTGRSKQTKVLSKKDLDIKYVLCYNVFMVRQYKVINTKNQESRLFTNRNSARRYADKLDNVHGSYIAQIIVQWDDQFTGCIVKYEVSK